MTELERNIKEIKESIDQIKNHLGIGKITPATVIDLRERAKRKAEKLGNQEDRRKKIPD